MVEYRHTWWVTKIRCVPTRVRKPFLPVVAAITRRYSRFAPTQNAAWQVIETLTPVTIDPWAAGSPSVATIARASAGVGAPRVSGRPVTVRQAHTARRVRAS